GMGAIALAQGDIRARANTDSTVPLGIFLCLIGGVTMIATLANWNNRRVQRRRQENVCYAVTDRRAVMWIPEPKSDAVRVLSVPGGQIKNLERVERPDGSGNLEFPWPRHSRQLPWKPYGFEHIPDVRRVEQIVRNNLLRDESRT